jgi:thioesterase domain-containing protein
MRQRSKAGGEPVKARRRKTLTLSMRQKLVGKNGKEVRRSSRDAWRARLDQALYDLGPGLYNAYMEGTKWCKVHNVTSTPMQQDIVEPKCFPASLNQQRLWILDQLEPGIAAYHIPVCLRLTGPLAVHVLKRGLEAIVARHESLRTTFGVSNGAPVQLIKSSCTIPLQVRDMSGHPGADLEAQAYSFARSQIKKPFDLSNSPLIRAVLLRLSPEQHILVITMHHIVSDGWSAELLVRELAEHYDAFLAGREPTLKPLSMQYSDFTNLQRHLIGSELIKQQLSFWRKTLAGAPALHDFPCDCARPEQPTYAGASQTLRMENELVADLQEIARRHHTTFFMLLTAAFQVLLSKYSKQQDILIGIPVSGRNMAETEMLIGLFVNTIVLRTSLSGNPTFIEVLKQVRENLLDAMNHQDIPFEQIVDAVRAPRRLGYNPLFQIMFATFRAAVQSRGFGPLTAMPYVVESNISRFDLTVNVIEGLDRIWWVQAEYSTELFDHPRIAAMLEAYKMLLGSIRNDSRQRLSELRVSHDAEEVSINVRRPMTSAAVRGPIAGSSIDGSAVSGLVRLRKETESTTGGPPSPFDCVERKLVEIWQRVLKTSPIAVDADFFELGGNSLLAIRMTTEINRTFAQKIPVTTLFRNATIQALGKRLRSHTVFKPSFFPLVESGTNPHFFVVGSNHRIRYLSRALGSDQPFYQMDVFALQEERLIAGQSLLMTVEDIAAHFVKNIIAVQPSGPYFLAGQCEGGIVALEIARQLQEQGQDIATLMLFDTPVRGYFLIPGWHRRVMEAFRRGELTRRLLPAINRRVRKMLSRLKREETTDEEHIWNVIWIAVSAYKNEGVFEGELALLRATDLEDRIAEDVAAGWDRLGRFRLVDIHCGHSDLFMNPDAQSTIQRILTEARQRLPPNS